MAKFDHERAHMAANLVSDPPVNTEKHDIRNNKNGKLHYTPFTQLKINRIINSSNLFDLND